jgi:hypothetical protein
MKKTVSLYPGPSSYPSSDGFLSLATDLRVLFERVLAASASNPSPSVWNLFLEFEYITADLPSIQKLEKRRALAFPDSGRAESISAQTI